MTNYLITRSDKRDGEHLEHWKYIKKVKKNGKTRYIYDRTELDKYDKGVTEHELVNKTDSRNKRNERTRTTTTYRKTNDMFGGYQKHTGYSMGMPIKTTTHHITYEQGKADRAWAKAEKYVYDTFYKENSTVSKLTKSASKTIQKGKKWLSKLFG